MITIRKYRGQDDVYEVDIRIELPSGETIRERKKSPVTGKQGTQRWAEQRERELIQQGTAPKPKKLGPTLKQYEPDYMQQFVTANRQKHSTKTFKESVFRTWLVPHFGELHLSEIDHAKVQKLKAAMTGVSDKHTNNVLSTLATVLQSAVDAKLIDALPVEIKLVKVTEGERPFYEPEDYGRLLEAAHSIDPDHHVLCLLGGDAGLRAGEILAIQQQDVDHRRGSVLVQHSEYRGVESSTKGRKPRRVPMTRKLAAALKSHRHLRGARVLPDLTYKVLTTMLAAAEKRAGLEVTGNLHKLRHSFCSHLAMMGAPARSIQELAGHKDLKTTLRYMHLSPSATDRAIRLLDGEIVEKGSELLKNG